MYFDSGGMWGCHVIQNAEFNGLKRFLHKVGEMKAAPVGHQAKFVGPFRNSSTTYLDSSKMELLFVTIFATKFRVINYNGFPHFACHDFHGGWRSASTSKAHPCAGSSGWEAMRNLLFCMITSIFDMHHWSASAGVYTRLQVFMTCHLVAHTLCVVPCQWMATTHR